MNPLHYIPSRYRAAVLISALITGSIAPIILPSLSGWPQILVTAIAASLALFANTQSLSNLTSDEDNEYITQPRHAIEEE